MVPKRLFREPPKAPAVWILPLVLLFLAPAIPAEYAVEYPERMQGAHAVGSEACMDCHDEMGAAFLAGLHRETVGKGEWGCESCHGPGSIHVESGETADIVTFDDETGAALASSLCLSCHGLGDASMFEGSAHGLNGVSCTSCHQVHGEQRTGLLAAGEPGLCYQCHAEVEAEFHLPSHHPVREEKMVCSDCHDNHTQKYQNILTGEGPNDLCFSCHADKQGPFIFEHAPVVEDCGICHMPHGAVANDLLAQNEPFLCLQCHQMHFHAQLQGIEGDFETKDGYTGTSTEGGIKSAFLTNCSRCHQAVHGSDLPSQSISGQGKSLTR